MENLSQRDLKFNITSGLLKTYQTPDGQRRLKTVASSTIKDRGGDVMTENAIRRMADSAKQNMTIFLNHSYSVPEDVFGSVEDVTVVKRGDIWDLDFDVRLNESNPRALKTFEAIENGTKLGTSIGARILEDGAKRDKSTGGWVFDAVELLEASIVGIPANPRSWVQHAVKSLENAVTKDVVADPVPEPEPDPEPDDVTKAKVWVNQDPKGNTSIAVDTDEAKTDEAKSDEPTDTAEHKDVQPAVTKDADPDPDKQDPDAEELSAAQEGQPTSPESASDEEETPEAVVENVDPEVAEAMSEMVSLKADDFTGLFDLLKATMSDLVEARKAFAAQQSALSKAEGDLGQAQQELGVAKEIIDTIADLPIGRRSGFDSGVQDFRTKFSNLYGEDFLKMLEKKNDT